MVRVGPTGDLSNHSASFECMNCGAPVDIEVEMRGDQFKSVRFPCSKCGRVGKGARIPMLPGGELPKKTPPEATDVDYRTGS